MKIIELNRPALHQAKSLRQVNVTPYVQGQMYMSPSRIVSKATVESPAYRIVKPYEVDGTPFALSMLITNSNVGKAEKWLDKMAETVTKKQLDNSRAQVFVYLDERYKP